MTTAIIIPFRDRGVDPLRFLNLKRVLEHWDGFGTDIHVVSDGRAGSAQFNRSSANNRGAAATDADVLVYTESDILVDHQQIREAITLAGDELGMVVPFTHQKKLTSTDSVLVRSHLKEAADCVPDRHPYGETTNYGCVNVISRATLAAVGQWDENFEGHGHDDSAMWLAFNKAAGQMRWVDGSAYHLYHLGFDPELEPDASHITQEDRVAQGRNYQRMVLYCYAKTPEEIRQLTGGAQGLNTSWRSRWSRREQKVTP
jgi:hypothetical protein